jgi:hypothetical protein
MFASSISAQRWLDETPQPFEACYCEVLAPIVSAVTYHSSATARRWQGGLPHSSAHVAAIGSVGDSNAFGITFCREIHAGDTVETLQDACVGASIESLELPGLDGGPGWRVLGTAAGAQEGSSAVTVELFDGRSLEWTLDFALLDGICGTAAKADGGQQMGTEAAHWTIERQFRGRLRFECVVELNGGVAVVASDRGDGEAASLRREVEHLHEALAQRDATVAALEERLAGFLAAIEREVRCRLTPPILLSRVHTSVH